MSLAKRSVTSVGWNVLVSIVQVVIGIVRYPLLAIWLPVESFGVYQTASSIVAISAVVAGFGMMGAFLHRSPETADEEQAAAVHFTLEVFFVLAWSALLVAGALFLASGPDRTALLILTAVQAGILLTNTPRAILIRRVVHRRLALLQLFNVALSSAAALYLAWRGAGLWALLATDIITLLLTIAFLYVWRPVWRPRLTWSPPAMRYFLRFGSRNALATMLLQALNHVDDLWTRAFLGKEALGYYSRAYTFATYPRILLAASVNTVAGGTYAELKAQRKRLSQAFFRTNALLVRTGFYLAGVLALIIPEFIHLVITDKWLPMLPAFRLMLVFTLLDPIKITVADLFVAMGRPEKVVRARLAQLGTLVVGLFLLGPPFGISGVALAVDLMLVVGIALLLWQAREYVDLSVTRLFAVPALALGVGLAGTYVALQLAAIPGPSWWTGLIKAAAFSAGYGLVLFALEYRQLLDMAGFLSRNLIKPAVQALGLRSPGDEGHDA